LRKASNTYFATLPTGGSPVHVEVADIGEGRFRVQIDGKTWDVDAAALPGGSLSLLTEGRSYDVVLQPGRDTTVVGLNGLHIALELVDEGRKRLKSARSRLSAQGPQTILAPMPGKVARVLVQAGEAVAEGQGLVVVEAMKMENELKSPKEGTVVEVAVREGQAVEGGAKLVVVG
jgi:biotin carboxyl carrier protein